MYQIVIIGSGLSGIKEFIAAYEKNRDNILMIDFEDEMGTLINDIGTETERAMLEYAHRLPYEFWNQATATNIQQNNDHYRITVKTVAGTEAVKTKNITIATGAKEQAREGHAISGSRSVSEMTPSRALSFLKHGNIPGLKPLIILNSDIARAVARKLYSYPNCQVIVGEEADILSVNDHSRLLNVHIWNKKHRHEQTIACDALIYSEGTIPNTSFVTQLPIKLDEYGFIYTNSAGETSLSGIYAVGDCVT